MCLEEKKGFEVFEWKSNMDHANWRLNAESDKSSDGISNVFSLTLRASDNHKRLVCPEGHIKVPSDENDNRFLVF